MLRRNESIENQGYKGYSSYDEYERDYYSAIKLEDTRREIVRIQDELQTASYPRRGLLETKLSTLRWHETYYESKAKEEEYERERRRNFEAQKEASAREVESKREEEAREESAQWERPCTQYPEGSRVVGIVKSRVPGGLMVDVDGVDMFLPRSQIDVSPVKDDASYIGQTFELEVLVCGRRNTTVSRRTLLEKVMAKERAEVLSRLEKGEIFKGCVIDLKDSGAIVEISSGVRGYVHKTEISWTRRVVRACDALSIGDEVSVVAVSFSTKNGLPQVALSIRRCQDNPWDTMHERFPVGSIVKGTVEKLVPYGVFIKMEGGFTGLVHISEIADRHVKDVKDVVTVGQEVEASVLAVAREAQRIALSIKAVRRCKEKAEEKKVDKLETNSNGRYKIDLQLSKEEKIYVDGYNILRECFNDELKDGRRLGSRGLILLMAALEKANLEAHIVFDAPVRYFLKENKDEVGLAFMRFLENEKRDMYTIVPADSRADDFILMLADNNKSHIISNDRFKEFVRRYPWVGKKSGEGRRVHRLKIADGWLMLPTIGVSMALHSDVNKVPLEKK